MTAVLAIAAAVIGALFWADRRRRYDMPVIVSNGTAKPT
jgi:hypothetical protein